MTDFARDKRRLIVVQGVYRSASTWAFNVCSELLRQQAKISTGYADHLEQLEQIALPGLVKSHMPTPELVERFEASGASFIVTVREPLDCVASLMRQFYIDFHEANAWVAQSGAASVEAAKRAGSLVLFYEKDKRDAKTIKAMAAHLALEVDSETISRVKRQLSPKSVKSEIAKMSAAKRFDGKSPRSQYDAETHWHVRHIGTGAHNTYKNELSAEQIAEVMMVTKDVRAFFGYQSAS